MAAKKAAAPEEEYSHETHMPVIHQFDETGKLLGVTKAESHETNDKNPEPWSVHQVGQEMKSLEGMGLKPQLGFLRRPQPLTAKPLAEGSSTKRVPAKNPKPRSAAPKSAGGKKPATPKSGSKKPAAPKAGSKKGK